MAFNASGNASVLYFSIRTSTKGISAKKPALLIAVPKSGSIENRVCTPDARKAALSFF